MEKVLNIGPNAWADPDRWGPGLTVVKPNSGLVKSAFDLGGKRRFDFRIEKFLANFKPQPHQMVLVVTPLGSYENWGPNVNGDGFERIWIEPENKDYGHKSFEVHAGAYRHHVNKDPSKSFGNIPLSVYDPHMHRIEFVLVIDRNKAEGFGHSTVVQELDRGVLPDVSMGCRVPYDICSVCGNRAKTRADYCEHLRKRMLEVFSDGKIACALNPRPKYFDISFVVIKAAKEAAVLAKVASQLGGSIPSTILAEIVNSQAFVEQLDRDMDSSVKLAGETPKLAELRKYFPAVYAKLVKPMYDSESPLPDSIINQMSSCTLPESLASSASMGIVLRPREFQKIYLSRTGRGDLAERLHHQGHVFAPQQGGSGSYRMDPGNIVPWLVRLLESQIGARSVFHPFVSKRILIIQKSGKRPQEPELEEKTGSELDEVGVEYAKYITGMATIPKFLKASMDRSGELFSAFADANFDSMSGLSKMAGQADHILAALGLVIPTYLLAAKWRSEARSGDDLGLIPAFVSEYPTASAAGLLTGGHFLKHFAGVR